ncbi:MAG: hypothetical protein CL610_05970 [Anaerolineaceae bacterium]|nr:hypothetical protein [Anaerolineaceae bacterium]
MIVKVQISNLTLEYEEFEEPPVHMKRCSKCGEQWPATTEFFYFDRQYDTLRNPCIACVEEKRKETNATTPCCVAGCDKPRYVGRSGNRRYSRCTEHLREQHRAAYARKKQREGRS